MKSPFRKLQSIVGLIMMAALVLQFSASPRVLAQPKEPPPPKEIAETVKQQKEMKAKYEKTMRKMEKHLFVKDGQIRLKVKRGAEIDVDETIFTELKSSLDETNALIKQGKVKLSEVRLTTEEESEEGTPPGSTTSSFAASNANSQLAVSCDGINAMYNYWWGTKLYFNRCVTETIIWAATVSAAALCWWTGACGGIGAVIIAVGVGYIQWLNNVWQRGIYVVKCHAGCGYIWHQ